MEGYRRAAVLSGSEHDELRVVRLPFSVSGVDGLTGLERAVGVGIHLGRFFLGIRTVQSVLAIAQYRKCRDSPAAIRPTRPEALIARRQPAWRKSVTARNQQSP